MPYFVGVLDGSGDVWGAHPRHPRLRRRRRYRGSGDRRRRRSVARHCRLQARRRLRGAPKPPALSEIVASGEIGAGESAVMIPLLLDSGRTVRASISLDAAPAGSD
jgi:hypothetical protein